MNRWRDRPPLGRQMAEWPVDNALFRPMDADIINQAVFLGMAREWVHDNLLRPIDADAPFWGIDLPLEAVRLGQDDWRGTTWEPMAPKREHTLEQG